LAEYQPDLIKIDMDLVRRIDQNQARQAIVRAVATLCGELGIRVGGDRNPGRTRFSGFGRDRFNAGLLVLQAGVPGLGPDRARRLGMTGAAAR
jgi:hypothetical protein